MKLTLIARLAGVVAITAALAGCMDVTSEIDVQSETTGKATTTMTMGAEFYPMIKQMQEAAKASAQADKSAAPADASSSFCAEEGDKLTENADGSATCVTVKEGVLAELTKSDGPDQDAVFTVVSPGVVKVAFKTDEMTSQVTKDQDAQTQAMMKAYFEGHNATIRIKGKKITDTNLTLSSDGTSAEIVIPFTQLLDGTAKLPAELYAVVDTN